MMVAFVEWVERLRLRMPPFLGYLLGVLTPVALTLALVRFDLWTPKAPFLPYVVAAMLLALLGTRVAVIATVLSGFLAWYFLLDPTHRLDFRAVGLVGGFLVVGGVLILLAEAQRDARRRLSERHARLAARQERLIAREIRLRGQLSELQALYDQAPLGLGMLDADLRFVRINGALAEMNGFPVEAHLGRSVWDLVPALRESAEPALRGVIERDEPVRDVEIVGETPAKPGVERIWMEHFYPIHAADGSVQGVGIVCQEVTEFRRAQDRERLLSIEVDHRAKNFLAVIQSILRLTRAKTLEEFRRSVEGRVRALGHVHTLLAESRWEGVGLAGLVTDELLAFGAHERVQASGPEVSLRPAAAQSIALVIHELLTNAVKHGALSNATGGVDLKWRLEGAADTGFVLEWRERGGPPPSPGPAGFGSNVIRSSVERQLGGKLDMRFDPGGLTCTVHLPRRELADSGMQKPAGVPEPQQRPEPAQGIAGRRILVVEDEALLAMQVEALLEEMGCTVVGPAADVSGALDLVHAGQFDAALLDYNLGGSFSVAVAEALVSRGIPFAFCSGYEEIRDLPPLARNAPVLGKPLEEAKLRQVLTELVASAA